MQKPPAPSIAEQVRGGVCPAGIQLSTVSFTIRQVLMSMMHSAA